MMRAMYVPCESPEANEAAVEPHRRALAGE